MSRAWEESDVKSRRIAAAWSDKRKRAAVPAWLRLNADRTGFDAIEERAELIRRIFQMAIDGYGIKSTAVCLNKERVDT
jgi:DNA invertase Pin-like site-specific DNA recombinase